MENHFDRIKNFTVSVKEMENDVLFLRKLVPGGSAHSFQLCGQNGGMPRKVIKTAEQKLRCQSQQTQTNEEALQTASPDMQLSFINLDDPLLEELRDEIIDLDIDTLTPVEALMKLNAKKPTQTKIAAKREKMRKCSKFILNLPSTCESSSGVEHHLAKVRSRVQIRLSLNLSSRSDGGIGRHVGIKIHDHCGRAGSSPAPST